MSPSEPSRTPTGSALWRGVTRRCAYCGSGHLFHRWFTMVDRCPGCGLRFQRLEGHWSGDIGINTVVTFSLLWFVLLGGTLAMWGHVNYVALGVTAGLVVFVFPIAFMPFAKTLWVAIDVVMRPVQADELTSNLPRTKPTVNEADREPTDREQTDRERSGRAERPGLIGRPKRAGRPSGSGSATHDG